MILMYIVASFVIAFLGENRKIGFGWALIASLVLSPILGLVITLCSEKNENKN